jgi:cytochrome c553
MKTKISIQISAAVLAALLSTTLPMIATSAEAKQRTPEEVAKLAESCKACHGEGGAKPIQPDYPVLAGQHRDYLAAALSQYKSGKRKNAVMAGFAAALKPEDIKDLAEYFSKQPSELKVKY